MGPVEMKGRKEGFEYLSVLKFGDLDEMASFLEN
jgi:hypothetical protein